MSDLALDLSGLHCRFGDQSVLEDFALQLAPGERLASVWPAFGERLVSVW